MPEGVDLSRDMGHAPIGELIWKMSIPSIIGVMKSILNLSLRHFSPDWSVLREVILIGIPSFLQLSGYSISILVVNIFLKEYGSDLNISTYGIVSKVNTLLLFPVEKGSLRFCLRSLFLPYSQHTLSVKINSVRAMAI